MNTNDKIHLIRQEAHQIDHTESTQFPLFDTLLSVLQIPEDHILPAPKLVDQGIVQFTES